MSFKITISPKTTRGGTIQEIQTKQTTLLGADRTYISISVCVHSSTRHLYIYWLCVFCLFVFSRSKASNGFSYRPIVVVNNGITMVHGQFAPPPRHRFFVRSVDPIPVDMTGLTIGLLAMRNGSLGYLYLHGPGRRRGPPLFIPRSTRQLNVFQGEVDIVT
jgi:hypothetical protein